MFDKKQTNQVVAISLIVAAASMIVVFLSVCIRRKSLSKALLAVAAMEGTLGALLLAREHLEERRANAPRFAFDGPDEEMLDETDLDAVEDHLDEVLSGVADREPAAKPIFTIPVDEEATVADFEQ